MRDMADEALEASWARTRGHLREARRLIDGGDALTAAYLRAADEFVAANELELAMTELEAAGDAVGAPKPFWAALARAADEMELTDRAAALHRRAG